MAIPSNPKERIIVASTPAGDQAAIDAGDVLWRSHTDPRGSRYEELALAMLWRGGNG